MTPESPRSPRRIFRTCRSPAPSDVLALLRWAIAAFKASRGSARTAIRLYHAAARGGESGSSSESLAAVAIAIATDWRCRWPRRSRPRGPARPTRGARRAALLERRGCEPGHQGPLQGCS